MEEEFYRQVNQVISEKITPIYNTFILIFAAFFAYFVMLEQNQCYSKDKQAYGVQYSKTENVTEEFYWLSLGGMFMMIIQAITYYMQSKEDMFDKLRPLVIFVNLSSLVWFYYLHFYRFKDSGRACSGDYFLWGSEDPAEKETVQSLRSSKIYLVEEGQWFLIYIISQYMVYFICKIISLVITNNLEAEFEEKKAQI